MFFPVSNMQISQIISEINKTLHSVVRAEPVKPKNEAENSDRSALETVNNDSDKKYEGIPFHKNAVKIDYADRGLSVEEYLNVIAYRVPSLCAFSTLAIQIQYPPYANQSGHPGGLQKRSAAFGRRFGKRFAPRQSALLYIIGLQDFHRQRAHPDQSAVRDKRNAPDARAPRSTKRTAAKAQPARPLLR